MYTVYMENISTKSSKYYVLVDILSVSTNIKKIMHMIVQVQALFMFRFLFSNESYVSFTGYYWHSLIIDSVLYIGVIPQDFWTFFIGNKIVSDMDSYISGLCYMSVKMIKYIH